MTGEVGVVPLLQLDTSGLPEITVPRGHGKGSRPGTETQDQNGDSKTPPSGPSDNDSHQHRGKQDGADQDESSQRQRKQRKSGKSRG